MSDTFSPIRMSAGVKVFGSAVVRIAPDCVSINVAVCRIEKEAKEAFATARRAAQKVHTCLQQAGIMEFGCSRVALTQEFRHAGGESKFIGYQAKIGYNLLLKELDRFEDLLTGLLGAGANELTSVVFQTSRLKEIRAEARRRAVLAAREKADLYCRTASVVVGKVIGIEDLNPTVVSGRQDSHVQREPVVEDDGEMKAVDPGAIAVCAAVHVVYEIGDGIV